MREAISMYPPPHIGVRASVQTNARHHARRRRKCTHAHGEREGTRPPDEGCNQSDEGGNQSDEGGNQPDEGGNQQVGER